jgi:GTPase SAR1 family protein
VLVGCKKDLRNNPERIEELTKVRQQPVSYEQGRAIATQIGAMAYYECSALTGEVRTIRKNFVCLFIRQSAWLCLAPLT